MNRLEFITKHGLEGAKLGIIPIEWLVKYDAYLVYLEALEPLRDKKIPRPTGSPKTPKSEAILIAAEKCRCDKSTIAKYIYLFERECKQVDLITIDRSGHRWKTNFAA